jgi:DNA-binding SARP family transcriptional activator
MKSHRPFVRSVALAATIACAILLVLLLELRPALPPLPRPLWEPVTVALGLGVLRVVGWVAALLLVFLLLRRSFHELFARGSRPGLRVPAGDPRIRSLGKTRLAIATEPGGFPPPFPLVLSRRPESNGEPHALALAFGPAREGVVALAAQGLEIERVRADVSRSLSAQTLPRPSIALLGPVAITPANPTRRWLRAHTQELLTYLALHPEGATSDDLIGAIWPDLELPKARKQVWRTVSDARARLGEVILRSEERYRLDRRAVAVDLDLFEGLLAEADALEGADRRRLLEEALSLVHGQPLAGSDFSWAAGDIRRLRAMIVERLEQLGYMRLDGGNAAGALAVAERAIALDAFNEGAHRLAMEAESLVGLRGAVAERFERLKHELSERFGLEPERETLLLYRRLLSQDSNGVS